MPEFLTDLRYAREPDPARTNSPAPGVRTGFAGRTVPCTIKLQTMNRITAILTLLLSFLAASSASAQPLTLDANDLPEWRGNTRFLTTHFPVKHPSLSLNGFDCASNCSQGYGLKQVLEKIYGSTPDSRMQATWKKILDQARKPPLGASSITAPGHVRSNTEILQARALVALASYVLKQNGIDPTNPATNVEISLRMPSAEVAVDALTAALMDFGAWEIRPAVFDDAIKWTTTLMNIARAMDLYLALENAYYEYDALEYECLIAEELLTQNEKSLLTEQFFTQIHKLYEMREYAGGLLTRYTVESGNAPLKIAVAVGYAAFAWQEPPTPILGHALEWIERRALMDGHVNYAFEAAGAPATGDDRTKYWHYQSSDGQKYWAEGAYYLHFALADVIPFWHAARINGLLGGTTESGITIHSVSNIGDPFEESWFLNPLHWLADTSTPDGKTMPLDDGNKVEMYNTRLLGWDGSYGNPALGSKFAWISSEFSIPAHHPLELAIPYQSKPVVNPLEELVGNSFTKRSDGRSGHQEVVLRKELNGKTHYVVLNGESGDAITRGEGHEQPDQMQLLYYVDSTSYIMDSGYDSVDPSVRDALLGVLPGYENVALVHLSSWNHYYDHNTMIIRQSDMDYDGGLDTPDLRIQVPPRIASEHQNVHYIFGRTSTSGRISELSASIPLYGSDTAGRRVEVVDYLRDVLVIADDSSPYLLDINTVKRKIHDGVNSWFRMSYWGNSETTTTTGQSGQQAVQWNGLYKSEKSTLDPATIGNHPNNHLRVQPFALAVPSAVSIRADSARESIVEAARGRGIPVKVLEVDITIPNPAAFITVAVIHALPDNPTPSPPVAQGTLVTPAGLQFPTWGYFKLVHSASKVDVLVVQEPRSPIGLNTDVPRRRLAQITEAGSLYLLLPADRAYGFARLENKGGAWEINPDYQLNLQIAPLEASIVGPACIEEGREGFYSAEAIGGIPPYSYNWEWYRICEGGTRTPDCDAWHALGSGGSSVQYGGLNGEDFKIRASVTDSANPPESVTVEKNATIEVLSPTEGMCPTDGGAAGQSIVQDEKSEEGGTESEEQKTEREASELADSVLERDESLPEEYRLDQNYPNPFNAETVLQFELPKATTVWLTVYDVLGRQVAVPVAGTYMAAGAHQVRFSATSLPSGHYFYHLHTADHSSRRRMILAK